MKFYQISLLIQLLTEIKFKTATVLCSSAKCFFVGDEDLKSSDMDILRHLRNSNCIGEGNTDVVSLEPGNMIKDVAVCRSVFLTILWHCILGAELTTHSFRLFFLPIFYRFCPLGCNVLCRLGGFKIDKPL